MSEDKYRAALDAAAKQLSYRALSAKMLRDKLLAKGHDEEAACLLYTSPSPRDA